MGQQVLIIGAGEIGKAISKVLSQKGGTEIKFWDKNPRLSSGKNLGDLVRASQFIFICVPSPALTEAVSDIKPHLRRRALMISLTKGLDKHNREFSSEILRRQFGKVRTVILAGPMIAEELRTGALTKATVGSTKKNSEKLARLLVGTSLSIEHSPDTRGVSVAGVLKNIYAMGFGMIDALKLGSNAKGVFINIALLEMEILIRRLGGRPETAHSLAGLGDLEATSHSINSANRVVGQKIIEGRLDKFTAEGLISLEPLIKRLGGKNIPPALSAIRRVVKQPRRAREIFESLIKNV